MKKTINIFLLSLLAFLPLACADGAEQLGDNLYRLENEAIEFSPPNGWALKQGPVPSIHLNFSPRSDDLSLASLGIVSCSAPFGAGFDMEKLMKATENDKSISSREMIDFDDTRAFSSVSEMGGLKTKSIQFLKDGNIFTITFVADNKDFGALLPAIEESLKTFHVISSGRPAPVSTMIPAQTPAAIPALLVAEPFQEKGQPDSVVKICLKSGTIVRGRVIERFENRLKLDFHGVPISVYFSDIDTMEGVASAVN